MKTHSLIFKGDHGNTREIAKINDLTDDGQAKSDNDIFDEANLLIRAFCAERHFKIYYTKMWNQDGITIFDVGSHTEFFHLKPAVNFNLSEANGKY